MPRLDSKQEAGPRQRAGHLHNNIATEIIARLRGRPTRIPRRGRRRLRWLGALERSITVDARASVEQMVVEGWDRADAAEAYRLWVAGIFVDVLSAGDEGGGQ